MIFCRYQERITVVKGRYILVVDVLMPMTEMMGQFMDEILVEDLLNRSPGNADSDDGWQDDGICSYTGAYLENRIAKVVSTANYNDEVQRLHNVPNKDTLKEAYEEYCKNHAEYSKVLTNKS